MKSLSAMRETQVQSMGGEDLLEKEISTHSSILAWRILWTGEPGGLQSTGLQRVGHDLATKITNNKQATGHYSFTGEFYQAFKEKNISMLY